MEVRMFDNGCRCYECEGTDQELILRLEVGEFDKGDGFIVYICESCCDAAQLPSLTARLLRDWMYPNTVQGV